MPEGIYLQIYFLKYYSSVGKYILLFGLFPYVKDSHLRFRSYAMWKFTAGCLSVAELFPKFKLPFLFSQTICLWEVACIIILIVLIIYIMKQHIFEFANIAVSLISIQLALILINALISSGGTSFKF